jgi:hypothetical protein
VDTHGRLIADHEALRQALGGAPSQWACYRFAVKLREHKPVLGACFSRVIAEIADRFPSYGTKIAIDASDMSAYPNGQKFLRKGGPKRKSFSDPDASWGHRSAVSTRKGGGFYGFRLHMVVCADTDLPVAWKVETARVHESKVVNDLLDRVFERVRPETATLDKGYDHPFVYDACEDAGALPIIALRKTKDVKAGLDQPPACEHGEWTFAGPDYKRGATKWRCPTGKCSPASTWRRANRLHPLIPRSTKRWADLYAGRSAVERAFGRLKDYYGLTPLRVRGIERVALHADLCVLAQLSRALARARSVPLAA